MSRTKTRIELGITKEESVYLHTEWWGECCTCLYWVDSPPNQKHGLRWEPGKCGNDNSKLFGQETWSCGCCPQWDSFDIELALEMLEESWQQQLAQPGFKEEVEQRQAARLFKRHLDETYGANKR